MRNVSLPNEILLPEVGEMLSEGCMVTLKTKGNSMLPFIIGGEDRVVLHKKNGFSIGDIVLARISPKHFVLHRIITIEDDKIILMGDGNLLGTEECKAENIFGYAIAIIHKGKKIDCNSKKERLKAKIWQMLLPIRRYLLVIYRRI